MGSTKKTCPVRRRFDYLCPAIFRMRNQRHTFMKQAALHDCLPRLLGDGDK
jgi:hypothetical protein